MVGSCDVYIKVYEMQCKKVSFTAEETYLWWERGDKWSSVQEPWLWFVSLKHPFPPIRRASAQWQRPAQWRRCAWSHTRGTESTAELEREDGSWNALQQLLLLTNGNLRRGKVILMQRMAQWGRSSCLFCHLKEEHSIWSRDRVLEVHTRQSGGERFVSPVTCSSGKCVCIMDVWYEGFDMDWTELPESVCISLFIYWFIYLFLVLKACQQRISVSKGNDRRSRRYHFCQSPQSGRMPAT